MEEWKYWVALEMVHGVEEVEKVIESDFKLLLLTDSKYPKNLSYCHHLKNNKVVNQNYLSSMKK